MSANAYVNPEMVRQYMSASSDRADDIGLDFSWTPEEVAFAMQGAARSYNSIPPLIGCLRADRLPADTNIFLDAVAVQLLQMQLQRLTREDIDYTAGGVTTNLVQKRIAHIKSLIDMHKNDFIEAAKVRKVTQNLRGGWKNF